MIKYNKVYRKGRIKTHISVVEGYRPGPGLPTKQRSIKSFGYLEDQNDPEEFMRKVEDFNNHFKDDVVLRIEVAANALMYSKENRRFNYGYKYLEAIYDRLEIGDFIAKFEKDKKFKGDYSPAEIFKFLVFMRILSPDSKRANCQMKNNFYGMHTEFTLPDVYRALDKFAGFEVELQRHLNDMVKGFIGRDLVYAFYDVTNYFFEIDFNDEEDGSLRHRGVSKEHRVDPIVGMGLFMDSNGLPVSMSIFPGNISETKTLEPTLADIKESYGLGRLIVVADKALNSSSNIDRLINDGDGFVFSQILKGKKGQRYHEQLFERTEYVISADGSYKYKLFDEEYVGHDKDGEKVTRKRRVLIYWSRAEAEMARHKREEKLQKAANSVANNVFGIKKGQDEFIKEDVVVKETGEYLYAADVKKKRSVDLDKADADSKYDGYFCIITSEMELDEKKIRTIYGGLWRIEQSFRILKSDLYARPVFVFKGVHIRAHFLICFTALLIIRIIQHKMGSRAISAGRIATALNLATCRVLKGGLVHLDDVGGAIAFKKKMDKKGKLIETLEYSEEDQIAQDYKSIQQAFVTGFYNIYTRQEIFNKFLKSITVS